MYRQTFLLKPDNVILREKIATQQRFPKKKYSWDEIKPTDFIILPIIAVTIV